MTTDNDDRAELVKHRLAAMEAGDTAERLADIQTRHLAAIQRKMIPVFASGQPARVKTKRFYDALAPLLGEIAPLAACRAGCSHCCHIAVAINQAEADLIGRATGRTPAKPDNRMLEGRQTFADKIPMGYDNPCPFLVDNRCSVYDARPLACRSHFNMDVDAELCRLDTGANPVPLYRTTMLDMGGVIAAGGPHNIVIADIREFFPPVGDTEK